MGLSYRAGMTQGEKIRKLREAKGWEQIDLARAVQTLGGKLSQSSVSDLERDVTKRPRYLREIAIALDTTEDDLKDDDSKPAPPLQANVRIPPRAMQSSSQTEDGKKAPPLLQWHTSLSGDRFGGWLLNAKRIVGEIPRPDKYLRADDAFRVEVIDNRNEPVYELSDILTINPAKQYQINRNHIFTGDPHAVGGAPCILARLIRETATEWIVRQYSSKVELKLFKTDYPNAWRVVDRTERP